MYRQTSMVHTAKVRVRVRLGLGLGLGLEFVHGRACASLLTVFIQTAGRVYNISLLVNASVVDVIHVLSCTIISRPPGGVSRL